MYTHTHSGTHYRVSIICRHSHQELGKKEQAKFAQNSKLLSASALRTALESFRHEFRAERVTAHVGKAMIFEQIVKKLGGNETAAKQCPQPCSPWPNASTPHVY